MGPFVKGRKLKDIKIEEVSFVAHPANRKPFLFFKQDPTKGIGIDEDKPKQLEKTGQLVCPSCGYKLDYSGRRAPARKKCPKCGTLMQCAAKKEVKAMNADRHAEAILKEFADQFENIELGDEYESFLDEKMDEEQIEKAKKLPPKILNAISGAFKTLNQFKDSLPAPLLNALSLMAKYVTGKYPYPRPYKKSDENAEDDKRIYTEEDLEKAGKSVSKAMATQLLAIRKILDDILGPEVLKKAMEEAQEVEPLELMKAIHTYLVEKDGKETENPKEKEKEEVEKKADEKPGDDKKSGDDTPGRSPEPSTEMAEVLKQIKTIGERLEIVEKTRSVKKKGLESDGSGDEDDKKELKKEEVEDEIPSWNIED